MKTLLITFALASAFSTAVQADDNHRHARKAEPNYILRRQEAYQVQGTPTSRLYIGGRKIDIYRNGLMFEGDNVVGIKGR
jgi:hypothetical protein